MLQGVAVAQGRASEELPQGGGLWGGLLPGVILLLPPRPCPQTRLPVLCLPQMAPCQPRDGTASLGLGQSPGRAQGGRNTCALVFLALPLTVQVEPTRWLLGNPRSWGSPLLSTPTLPLLACFLLCVQRLVLVLSWQLQGPREMPPRAGKSLATAWR